MDQFIACMYKPCPIDKVFCLRHVWILVNGFNPRTLGYVNLLWTKPIYILAQNMKLSPSKLAAAENAKHDWYFLSFGIFCPFLKIQREFLSDLLGPSDICQSEFPHCVCGFSNLRAELSIDATHARFYDCVICSAKCFGTDLPSLRSLRLLPLPTAARPGAWEDCVSQLLYNMGVPLNKSYPHYSVDRHHIMLFCE